MAILPFFWRDKYAGGKKGVIAVPGIKIPNMEITIILIRDRFSELTTQGKLRVGDKVYDTLEPPDRENKPKCIPPGVYKVVMEKSKKFGKVLPELKGVPGFKEVKIHNGNFPQDTIGCILVGKYSVEDAVYDSQDALREVLDMLVKYQSISIEIIDSRRSHEAKD